MSKVTANDVDLGDTFIDFHTDCPAKQWGRIFDMLERAGYVVVPDGTVSAPPPSLQGVMTALVHEAQRDSLMDVLHNMDCSDADYEEVRKWLRAFGVHV